MGRVAHIAGIGSYPIIEITDMTLGELTDVERISQLHINEATRKNTAGVSLAMLYVAIRRADPTRSEQQIRMIPSRDLRIEDEVASDPPAEGADA